MSKKLLECVLPPFKNPCDCQEVAHNWAVLCHLFKLIKDNTDKFISIPQTPVEITMDGTTQIVPFMTILPGYKVDESSVIAVVNGFVQPNSSYTISASGVTFHTPQGTIDDPCVVTIWYNIVCS